MEQPNKLVTSEGKFSNDVFDEVSVSTVLLRIQVGGYVADEGRLVALEVEDNCGEEFCVWRSCVVHERIVPDERAIDDGKVEASVFCRALMRIEATLSGTKLNLNMHDLPAVYCDAVRIVVDAEWYKSREESVAKAFDDAGVRLSGIKCVGGRSFNGRKLVVEETAEFNNKDVKDSFVDFEDSGDDLVVAWSGCGVFVVDTIGLIPVMGGDVTDGDELSFFCGGGFRDVRGDRESFESKEGFGGS